MEDEDVGALQETIATLREELAMQTVRANRAEALLEEHRRGDRGRLQQEATRRQAAYVDGVQEVPLLLKP